MRVRFFIHGLLWICTVTIMACEPAPSSEWVLLSEDSDGKPTFVDVASVRLREGGLAVYRRAVGDPSAADRVELVQGLDCVNLRWAFLGLDESLLDEIAEGDLFPEEWDLLALTPANRVLLDEVCEGFSPARWIRVLKLNTDQPGELKEVWVDRETITGPSQDTLRYGIEEPVFSEEIFRSWSRWNDASPDNGYLMVQADGSCDKPALRYLENSRYSREGELVSQAEVSDIWYPMFFDSFEERVFSVVCALGEFFQPDFTRGISPGPG